VLDRDRLRVLRERLAHSRVPSVGLDSWEQGVAPSWLTQLLDDWRSFDVGGLQDRLDELSHLRVELDGQSVHVVHGPGRGPEPVPLPGRL